MAQQCRRQLGAIQNVAEPGARIVPRTIWAPA